MKQYLTLNPAYILRQDGNRVVLCGDESKQFNSQDWFSFIHPYYGMLLSFFSRKNSNGIVHLLDCAKYFNKPLKYIIEIVSPFIDNDKSLTLVQKNGIKNSFPKNLIISSDYPIIREVEYSVEKFVYLGVPDYDNNRLYVPLNINLELTMQCITDCCYCYADRRNYRQTLLPTQRIIELIREAREIDIKNFDINGGEVMLHPDIKIILKELLDNHFKPLVSTKIPLKKEMLDYFKEIGLNHFQISLDSIDENILSFMLKTPRGYLNQIERLLEYASLLGIMVDVNTVLTKYNSEIKQIEDLLAMTSSFACVKKHRLNPAGFSLYKDNFEEIITTPERLNQIESKLTEWKAMYKIDVNLSYYECESTFQDKEKLEKFPKRAICTGNVWNMVILPDGDVTICEELYHNERFIIGNVSKDSILSVWQSKKALDLYNMNIAYKPNSACGICKDRRDCRTGKGVCWKTILMAYGDDKWDFPDPRCPKAPLPLRKFYY